MFIPKSVGNGGNYIPSTPTVSTSYWIKEDICTSVLLVMSQ